MALSKTTKDHDEIRQWAEKRGAKPAEVASTESNGKAGIIRLEFPKAPNANDSNLQEISWDEWFEKFDASGLELVYQEVTAEGAESNFNRLIYPENEKPAAKNASGKKSSSSKGGGSSSKGASASKGAAKSTGAKASSGKKSASNSAPAKNAPAKKAPAKKAPAKKAPAKKAPAKNSPAKKAPAKKAPAKKAPAKKSSGRR